MKKFHSALCLSILLSSSIQLNAQVTTGSGTQFVVSGDLKFVLNDISLANNGTLVPATSTIYFTGGNNQFISGSTPTLLHHLSVNKNTGSRISLQRNIDVDGNIIFNSGLLDLNQFNILLSPTSLLTGETETSRITGTNGGYIQITTNISSPVAMNPGNLGATFTSPANFGSTIIRRGHAAQSRGTTVGFSINRYFDIIPTNNGALNATLKFSYFDAELNGKTESELWLWKSEDLTNWFVSAATDTRDAITNYVTGKNINSFSRWTLSDASFPIGNLGPCEDNDEVKTWPNPFTDGFNVGFSSTLSGPGTLQLFDMGGRMIVSQPLIISTGRNLYHFSFPNIPSATYILRITGNNCTTTVGKIIKLSN